MPFELGKGQIANHPSIKTPLHVTLQVSPVQPLATIERRPRNSRNHLAASNNDQQTSRSSQEITATTQKSRHPKVSRKL